MKKTYKVINVPKEPTRHHLGNFGLVLIKEDLPQEICQAGVDAGLPYFEEVSSENIAVVKSALVDDPAVEPAVIDGTKPVKPDKIK